MCCIVYLFNHSHFAPERIADQNCTRGLHFSQSFSRRLMTSTLVAALSRTTIVLIRRLISELTSVDKLLKNDRIYNAIARAYRKLEITNKVNEINAKTNTAMGKELAASMRYFQEGVECLEKELDKKRSGYELEGKRDATGHAGGLNEALEDLNDLTRLLCRGFTFSSPKEKIEKALPKAVEAFADDALDISYRVLAMAVRIMSTILESVLSLLEKADDLGNALKSCKSFLEELHYLETVELALTVWLNNEISPELASVDWRKDVVASVCQMNSFFYDVIQMVLQGDSKARELLTWPCIVALYQKVDPLRDARIPQAFPDLFVQHSCVLRSFWCHKDGVISVNGMATNKQGQLMVSDVKSVKVFDKHGTFLNPLDLFTDNELDAVEDYIQDVATDQEDNIYVAIQPRDKKKKAMVKVYNGQAEKQHEFYLTEADVQILSIVVDDDKNILVSLLPPPIEPEEGLIEVDYTVQVYENRGKLLDSIKILNRTLRGAFPCYCQTAAGAGRVFVYDSSHTVLYIYGAQEKGGSLALEKRMDLNESSRALFGLAMTFHGASGYLFIASFDEAYQVSMYTKEGKFVRRITIETIPMFLWKIKRILVTIDGGVAVALEYQPKDEEDSDESEDEDEDEESKVKVVVL